MGTAPKPGYVSALFLGIAVICLGLGIGGHIYLRDPSQIDMFVRVFAMVCCSIPATVIGISGIIGNHRVCCRANLVEARVSGYEWDTQLNLSDSHNDEAVRTQLGMWVEFEHNGGNKGRCNIKKKKIQRNVTGNILNSCRNSNSGNSCVYKDTSAVNILHRRKLERA